MKALLSVIAALIVLVTLTAPTTAQNASCAQWLEHEITKLNSSDQVDLCAETAGKPVLLVNTASYCGFTYQFTGLETLYQRFKDEGLVVIGFPSDDFNQEDEDAAATAEICYINHGVTFPMTEVVKVKNADAHPVFAHLGNETQAPGWNFNKYLVGKDGEVLAHFGSNVEPGAAELIAAIEAALQVK
ncbi:MAG: glutathione peroxidase [Gammaproteobacteria bacterium]|nr:glutathione peroxidase [Gammaproteobacteria bacterium]MDP2140560.1 glutathione peroxidase [Gammaproteobacteria bacterium]MDP2347329.1 glutathione peroxidase [Gammaproteobacteria bacterium]